MPRPDPRDPGPLPSTLGGPGWLPRAGTLADDLRLGRHWGGAGCASEVGSLRRVLLVEPPGSLGAVEDPGAMLMHARIDLSAIRDEYAGLCAAYAAAGVEVVRYRAEPRPGAQAGEAPPNLIFARDLLWMTPEGAVIARMAAEQRAGEERHAQAALAGAGVPILASIRRGRFEGADALWIGPEEVAVGLKRTDAAALQELRALFPALTFHPIPVPPSAQHLLGVAAPVAPRLALLHPDAPAALRDLLAARGIACLAPDPGEQRARRAMNVVALGDRRVVMPSGCPRTRAALSRAGVDPVEVEVTQYLRAAGGPGCLTGIILREGETPWGSP